MLLLLKLLPITVLFKLRKLCTVWNLVLELSGRYIACAHNSSLQDERVEHFVYLSLPP